MALTNEGALYIWGGNYLVPTLSTINNLASMSVSDSYVMLLTKDGKVIVTNVTGLVNSALPNSNFLTSQFSPIGGLDKVTYIYNYQDSYFAVDENGIVWGWGRNSSGRLGDGTSTTRNTPVQVLNVGGVTEIFGLSNSTLFLTTSGKIFTTVNNSNGTIERIASGAKDIITSSLYLANDAVRYISNNETYRLIPSTIKVVNEDNGYFAVTNDGKLIGDGLIGNEIPNEVFTTVFSTNHGSLVALTESGTLYMWGQNNQRQLADLTTNFASLPKRIPFGISVYNQPISIESQNIRQGDIGVDVTSSIVIDFNTAIKQSNNFGLIQLLDSNNIIVPNTKIIQLDKVIITPNVNLKFNELYTVNFPGSSVVDYFGNSFNGTSFKFITAETLLGAVELIPVTSISIVAPSTTINVGNSIKLTTELNPSDTTQKTVRWTSSDTSIATVDMYGNVYAQKKGIVTITASNSDRSVTATIQLTVYQPVTSVGFDTTNLLVPLSSTPTTINYSINPESASDKSVKWETSNPDVAYINDEGKLVTIAYGTAILRLTSLASGIFNEIAVSVIDQTEATLEFKQIVSGQYNSQNYIFGLADDGKIGRAHV
jgi:uncharacterized protein YjdB